MPEREERTFFPYSDGYSPQELSLGHLVFGNFARPTKGRQCSMEPLSEADLETWANVQLRPNFCYSSESLRGFGIAATAIDLVKIGISRTRETQHAVASVRCRRITLKNPEKFLTELVLSNDSTRKTVQKWLSVSSSEFALKMLTPLGWWPKIWMLTGFYELEDCSSFSWSKSDVSAEAGVAAEVMALLNIPLGADASIHRVKGRSLKQDRPGKTIWAAEYQLVDATFKRVSSAEKDKPVTAPLELPLQLRAVYSSTKINWRAKKSEVTQKNAVKEPDDVAGKKAAEKANNMAVLGLVNEVSSAEGGVSEREDKFWELFLDMEEDWEDGYAVDD